MRVLVIKMSSLGDVVHALPGVTDAAAALGSEARFDWVVEEAFAPIPARHPAVGEVLPVAWRRWRGNLWSNRARLRDFASILRARRYDVVLDAQGLIKSAAVCALARGDVKAGLSRNSAREGAAAVCYTRRVSVPTGQHAVDRIRQLFAGALRYPVPQGAADFGLSEACVPPSATPRCLLLHGTTWDSKHWPEGFWRILADRARAAGFEVLLPWGSEVERQRAQRIAADGHGRVLERLPLTELIDVLAGCALVIGVDSGLAHLAAALAVPTVVVYGPTSSALTGCRGRRVDNLQSTLSCSPCLARTCRYRGPEQVWQDRVVRPACFASVDPDRAWSAAMELVNADRILHI